MVGHQNRDPSADERIDDIANNYVDALAALDPIGSTALGLDSHDDRVTDLSPDGFDARAELTQHALLQMMRTQPALESRVVARDSFLERLGVEVEMEGAGLTRSHVSVVDSCVHQLREAFELMPRTGERALANLSARLEATPKALTGYQVTLLDEAAKGHVSASRQYVKVAAQLRRWSGQGDVRSYFHELVGTCAATASLKRQLDKQADAATAAVLAFARFLESDMAPRGHLEDAVGREHYELRLRMFLGAVTDPREAYDWAWDELKRISREMEKIARDIAPGATPDEVSRILDDDPKHRIEGASAFCDWMQERTDRTFDQLGGRHFDIPAEIRRLRCRIAATADGTIYYTGPSENFSRPGQIWWSVPEGKQTFSTWREATNVHHEGVPGHHLQVATSVYRADTLNRWQRLMCWVSGHGEGWALYAETLMAEFGLVGLPETLGMLDAQRLRTARVILDIGLHLGLRIPEEPVSAFRPGELWNPVLAREFLRDHSHLDDRILDFEIDRYLGWPGQAPSYKLGERCWLEARSSVESQLGRDFNLKAFHHAALDLGSIGLDPMLKVLTNRES